MQTFVETKEWDISEGVKTFSRKSKAELKSWLLATEFLSGANQVTYPTVSRRLVITLDFMWVEHTEVLNLPRYNRSLWVLSFNES